jgi:hypothetical protein
MHSTTPLNLSNAVRTSFGARLMKSSLLQCLALLIKQGDFDTLTLKEFLNYLQARNQITEPISFEELQTSTMPQSFLCGKVYNQLAQEV